MATGITALRSDLIELRLKQLGGTGTGMLERARSLQDRLGRPCMARIRAVAAMRERYAGRRATMPMGWIDRMLFLEDCEVVDRRLQCLIEESKPRRTTTDTATDIRSAGVPPWNAQPAGSRRAFEARRPFASVLFGLGEHVGPVHEPVE